jgi:hypothetical protein
MPEVTSYTRKAGDSNLYSTNALSLLRTCTPIDKRLSLLPNFPEIQSVWTGKPILPTTSYFRPNALMRERCQLVRLTSEVVNLIFSLAPDHTEHSFVKAARALTEKMEHWYSLLPVDLQFHKNLPAPIYELQ